MSDPVDRLDAAFGARILERAARCDLRLESAAIGALLAHAKALLEANAVVHLTAIVDPDELLERHLGESFEGAAMIDAGAAGRLLDLGSGNGYPGLPVVAARPALRACLAESSQRKAAFLRGVLERSFREGRVIAQAVQRPADLPEGLRFRVITSRAMGGWERVLPRLAGCLEDDGDLLLWAGEQVEAVARRTAWNRYRLVERKPLPGRQRSWIWRFHRSRGDAPSVL